jgi:cytochrome P450
MIARSLARLLLVSIGKKFAMTEMMTVLAMLLQKFEFELVRPDYTWKFRPLGITLRPLDGMPLRLKPRAHAD